MSQNPAQPIGGGGQAAQPDIFSVRQDYQQGNIPALRQDWAQSQGLPGPGSTQSVPSGIIPPSTGSGSIVSTGQQPPTGLGLLSPAAGPAVSGFSPQALSQMAQLYQNPYLGAQMYGNVLNTPLSGPGGNAAWDASRFLNPSTLNQWGYQQPMPSSGAGKAGLGPQGFGQFSTLQGL